MPEPSVSGLPAAAAIAQRLIARGETVAVAEGAAGGLISAALLAVPGASAYFVGGAVIYTVTARRTLLGVQDADMVGMRPASEAYATLLARRIREVHGATWGLAETGASGPTGNRYGDPAGHACFSVAGLSDRVVTLRTGSADRAENMRAFTAGALNLLVQVLDAEAARS